MPDVAAEYSAGFAAILDDSRFVVLMMDWCFVLVAAVLIFPANIIRRLWLVLPSAAIGAIVAGIAADAIFTGWWNSAVQAAVNEADRKWIAYRDGGGLMVGVEILIRALSCFATITASALIPSIRGRVTK